MAKFIFKSAFNTGKFDYAALLNGAFSDQTPTSFTVRGDADVVTVSGHDFIYSDGTPIEGTIEGFDLRIDGPKVLGASGLNISVPELATDLANHDIAALRADFFGGDDLFSGSDQRDSIFGFDGDDKIRGHGGADLLDGGAGRDRLVGGDGADTFRFDATSDSVLRAPDFIIDLENHDTVDLHRIDADVTADGNQSFELVASFDGHAGEATVAYNPELDRTSLLLDVDGDAAADSVIYMQGDQTGFTGYIL